MALDENNLNKLWEEFSNTKSLKAKHQLIMHYIWLVKYVLQLINLPNNSILEEEDFINIGILGLHEAIERFELSRGVKFESYAIPRIK
ncbi:MAG: RNA polymerase sigma factor WhiG, partial [Ignavibacteriae bacterium]|nr:RNA polymerase sigma factor WhiG [Ignavibacteriota bacterium]